MKKVTKPTRARRVIVSALLALGLLTLPSCRIPQLCCAHRGAPLPDTFDGEACDGLPTACVGWRDFYEDPCLTCLIDQALVGNQELKILAQEVRIANVEVLARRGEYLPFVTLGAGAGVEKSGIYTRAGAVEENLLAGGKDFPEPLPNFLVAADVSWEIDIWRRLRNAKDAAIFRFLASRDGQNYVVTRLVADVAENYYELLALDNRLAILNKTIEIQEQTLDKAKSLKEAAEGTELGVQRFQAEVRKNESERFIIQQEIVEVENRINFLAGRFPQRVARCSPDYLNIELQALCVGVPSQLLRNRADIRQAEREVAAAGLDVRSARARFYPSFTLRAGVGYESFDAGFLFQTPESLIYNAAGELVAPVLNRAAIKAAYISANATQLQAIYNYQQTVLDAFTEVVNQMNKIDNYGRSIAIKKLQLESLEAAVDNAMKLFENAQVEYIEVLLAQRELMEARMELVETKQEQLAAVVNAYQALGGGLYAGAGGPPSLELINATPSQPESASVEPSEPEPVPAPERSGAERDDSQRELDDRPRGLMLPITFVYQVESVKRLPTPEKCPAESSDDVLRWPDSL